MCLDQADADLAHSNKINANAQDKINRKYIKQRSFENHCVGSRRRLHRSFLAWYWSNIDRFQRDLLIRLRTDDFIIFGFRDTTDHLAARLGAYGIEVVADYNDEMYDIIIDFDVVQQKVGDGYQCRLCQEHHTGNPMTVEMPIVYNTRDALWHNHMFEPFLEWANNVLLKYNRLRLFRSSCGTTWASLVMDRDVSHSLDHGSLVAEFGINRSPTRKVIVSDLTAA